MSGRHVLTFHVVKDSSWWLNTVIYIKKRFNLISIDDIDAYYYSGKKLKNSCHITFDDGHKSIYEQVFPLVKKYKIPISVYVSPKVVVEGNNYWFQEVEEFERDKVLDILEKMDIGYNGKIKQKSLIEIFKLLTINDIHKVIREYQKSYNITQKQSQNITIDQMLEMQESGFVTFGAHTVNHPILPNETDEQSEYEIRTSIQWLSDLTNRKVIYWAFPNGDCTKRELKYLDNYGIRLAFTAKNGTRFHKNGNPLLIPRTGFTYGNKNYLFIKMLFGKHWNKVRAIKDKITYNVFT